MLGGFGGKKKEEKEEDGDKGEEEENGDEKPEGEDGEGGDDEGEEEVQQVAKTRKINREQFFKEVRDRSEPPSRGDTEKERDHWSRPRRWQVRLWQVRIENMTDEAILVFANFIFGGTKEEFLVRAGGKEPSIWVAGDEGVVLRTPVVHDVPGDGEDTECDFDVSFEWHGSYLDLERQTLRVEIWNWARWRINKFDCFAEEPLLTFAKGPIQNEMECNKVDKFGKKQCRVQVAFKMFFQEIYDFELTMPVWRASAVPSCKRVLERLRDGIDEEEDEEQTMAGGRGTMARSTRAATQMQRAMSVTSDDLTQQSICIQTPSLLSQGTRSCYLRAKKSGNCGGSLMWDRWDRKRFRGYFRGTCSDLSNASLEVRLDSYERARDLKELLGGSKPGGSRYHMPLANAELPLRGVLEHGEVKASLRPAPWFFSLADGGRAHRQRCGLLQGHVAVENRPRYQQTDDVSDELDLRKRYLFVKVIKVDRVVTPDTRPTDEIDTFVEVTFDGVAKRTRICQDDVSPSFNDDLVFELALAKTSSSNEMQEDTEATWEELERKGPVFIDLWTVGSKSNEHLGSVEAFLQDVLVDEAGQPQKEVSRSARDARLKKQETFSVRAFRGQKRLKFTWGPGQESNIFYEMWFLPDLSPLAVLRPLRAEVPMPKVLADCYEEKTEEWDALADELNGVKEDMERIQKEKLRSTGRQFPSQAKSIWPVETTQEYWLPRFLDVLRPPHGVDSATAVCHYVGCFPYMESKAEDTVSAPNFFCALRKGKILEHCLLHCSLLLGLSCKAYVCGGRTLKGEPHFWVAVFEEDGTVRFWEPFLGTGSMALRRRFAFPQFLIPGKHAPRSLRDMELLRERRRRRRMLRSKGQLLLPAGRSAPKSEAPKAKAKVKKSMFRPAEQEDPHEGHEHDMVYVDILDLGLRERPTEDRGETGRRCATCNALPGGQYFSRGFNCEVCEKAGGSFMLCFSCADPLFKDDDQLQAADNEIREPFDLVKERFDFDAYNELRGPDDSNFVLPYKSVEVIFNNANIWMNLQDEDPRFIFWDLASKDYWQPFVPKVAGLRPCFSSCRFPMAGRDEGWCQQQRRELLQEMRKAGIDKATVSLWNSAASSRVA
ncbi:unnamed protein product [Effrenium voratum]|nr:unnamed protein product [Effrenium voratum]